MQKLTSPLVLVAALLAGTSVTNAQTTINLNYGPNKTCVFTTDGSGVSLDGTTGAIVATGTFANTGCPSGQTLPAPTVSSLQAIPGAPAVNSNFNLSFTSTNAARCTTEGTTLPVGATVTGWPAANTDLCTSTACSSVSKTVSASLIGNYSFAVKCYNSDGVATSSPSLPVTVQTGVTSCAPSGVTRQTTGRVQYYPGGSVRNNVNFTDYLAVYGLNPETGGTVPWPGQTGVIVIPTLSKGSYMSLPFTVPQGASNTLQGSWTFTQTGSTSTTSITVSTCEGDFTGTSLPTYCKIDNTGEGGGIAWSTSGAQFTCPLTPGNTYYLNYINAHLATPATSICPSTACAFGTKNSLTHN